MPNDLLQDFEQGDMDILMAHAKSERHPFKAKPCFKELNFL